MRNTPLVILGVIVLVILMAGGWGVSSYNGLIRQDQAVKAQWAQVENQLQRRYALIPNLASTVSSYAAHEAGVFTSIADSRAKIGGAPTPDQEAALDKQYYSALSRLLVIREAYPELKANENYIRMMDELAGTENRIATERGRYNEKVADFNTRVKVFPTVLIARMAGYGEKPFFQAPPEASTVPQVFTK
ncbi:MAG TPA: LemA family protein [Bacillota bacterium]|jgi:LemA protein